MIFEIYIVYILQANYSIVLLGGSDLMSYDRMKVFSVP